MYNHPFPVNTNDIHQRKLILILPFLIGPFVFWQAGRIFVAKKMLPEKCCTIEKIKKVLQS